MTNSESIIVRYYAAQQALNINEDVGNSPKTSDLLTNESTISKLAPVSEGQRSIWLFNSVKTNSWEKEEQPSSTRCKAESKSPNKKHLSFR